jgi:hypothetical protein
MQARRILAAVCVAALCLGVVWSAGAQTGTITTVAGTGTIGYGGDGGPAANALLASPVGVATDAAGNLFIADATNYRIRRVDAGTGIITTVVGTGALGFGGDGGSATSALLNFPYGVAIDAGGNLFLSDYHNHRIRRVDAGTGIITTVAGTGVSGYGGDGGPAVNALLNTPTGVAIDAGGNLFLSDYHNHRIRRVDAGTGIITTVAGTGAFGYGGDGGPATGALLNYPRGVATDASGNLFIADSDNHRVRRVDAGTGTITTVAGTGTAGYGGDGGPAANSLLYFPLGVVVDGAGTSSSPTTATIASGGWTPPQGSSRLSPGPEPRHTAATEVLPRAPS